jgi:hypothetical protein
LEQPLKRRSCIQISQRIGVWPTRAVERAETANSAVSARSPPSALCRQNWSVLHPFDFDLMNLLAKLDHLYDECRRNRWLRYFAVFCRIALALGFIPSGIVKVMGERFTALPSNHPLGHYFDALYRTGFYYTFIGVSQLTAALLLLILGRRCWERFSIYRLSSTFVF